MKTNVFSKNKLRMDDIVLYCYIFSIILTEGTMYGVLKNLYNIGVTNFTFQVVSLIIGTIAIIIFGFLRKFRIRISKNNVKVLIILFIYLLIYGIININHITTVFSGLVIPFFMACLIDIFYGKKRLFENFFPFYSNIVLVLACVSLWFYIVGTTLHVVQGISTFYTNNGWWYEGTNYYYLSFINNWQKIDIFGFTIVRNIGIFMEAPGYAVILQYAFWWELFGKNRINKKRIVILLITIFTTFSAKAYISSAFIIIMYLYSGQTTLSKLWKKIRGVLLPLLICLLVVSSFLMLRMRNISLNGGDSSFAIRISDYIAAFKAWKDFPVFGCGFYNLEKVYTYYPSFRNSGASTAGIMNVLAYGGVYMAIFYITPFVKYIRCNKYNSNGYRMCSFVALILFSFITGNVQYSNLVILFMAFGYMADIKNCDFNGISNAGLHTNRIS